MKLLILTGVMVFLATGCATQSYHLSDAEVTEPKYENSQAFFVEGIGQNKEVNAAEICGGAENIVKIESEQSAADVGLSIITLGIYTPRTAKVFCK